MLQVDNFWSKIFSKSPLCTPHVASGFLRTFNLFVKIFLSPRYVLHLLQVAVLMYSTYCKWLIFEFFFLRSPNYSKSPQRTPHVASGFWATCYFLVKIFLSPRYVLHLLQVAVLMYSTYCKWLIFEFFFFRSPNYSKSPQRTPHVASGLWATFYFLVKIFISPRYLLHLLQVAAGRKTVFRSLCFFAR